MFSFLVIVFSLWLMIISAYDEEFEFSFVSNNDVCNGDDYGVPGDYDFFVFAQSWSATFCSSHSSYKGCQNPTEFMRENLTIHGIFPSFKEERGGHAWPQCCQGGDYSISQATIDKYETSLNKYWPSEQGISPIKSTLWYEEVNKHGSCTTLDEFDFVGLVLNMAETFSALQTPTVIQANVGGSISLSTLQETYEPYETFFDCGDDGQTLTEIRTCWGNDLKQIDCPPIIMKEYGQCSSDTILIPSFENWTRQI